MPRRPKAKPDPALEAFDAGAALLKAHPLFRALLGPVRLEWARGSEMPASAWAIVFSDNRIRANLRHRAEPPEWAWVLAHALLHLGFEHLDGRHRAGWREATGATDGKGFDAAWNGAACLAVDRFLRQVKVGRAPGGLGAPSVHDQLLGASGGEEAAARTFRERGVPDGLGGVGGPGGDLVWAGEPTLGHWTPGGWIIGRWPDLLARGLTDAVVAAVDVAGGAVAAMGEPRPWKTGWAQALDWFVTNYPLLGGLAAAFRLVERADVAAANGIRIAAISPVAAELYVNPDAGLSAGERRFVIAHELLHAGLRHDTRSGGRDPWLWNLACDYVINGWLVEMAVGDRPDGLLYDIAWQGLSAEEVYDRITADWRRYRKLATLRGVELVDVLPGRLPVPGELVAGVDLDELFRRALADGLGYHRAAGRGLLPAGLVEEIRALGQPPVPWDVELARWFDAHFPPVEAVRSYARASRRQSASPQIPRPGRHVPPELRQARTFGVVLDTSGSMDGHLLGKALGAIASYAQARDVPAVRVVFCDAAAYDNGWMEPADIAARVTIRGRGGTVLQPGVDLLEQAADFPKDGPILVITDGECDRVRVHREHAFLTPAAARLPFVPHGPVFRLG